MKEREEDRVGEDTYPVWSFLHEGNSEITNYLYKPGMAVLYPGTSLKHIELWREMYLNPFLAVYSPQQEIPGEIRR